MATTPKGAGPLYEKVAFDKRETVNPDSPADYGATQSAWVEQFTRRANFLHLRGGESVMAGRLAGKHQIVVTVRAGEQTRDIGTDWRMRDTRTSVEYAIRDITPSDDRQFVEILVESGVTP